jgi:hypothetical protein
MYSAHFSISWGASSARATRRALLRIARVELLIVIDARETASTSPPTFSRGSRSVVQNTWPVTLRKPRAPVYAMKWGTGLVCFGEKAVALGNTFLSIQ